MIFKNHDEAIRNIRMALDVNPLSFYSNTILGLSLGIAGQLKEGLEKAKLGAAIEPSSYISQCYLACLYHWSGKYEDAVETFEIALSISQRHAYALTFLIITYLDWGKKEEGLALFEELVTRSKEIYISPTLLATANAALGFETQALHFVNQACHEHDPFLALASRCFPDSISLRTLPGFDQIVKTMKLQD